MTQSVPQRSQVPEVPQIPQVDLDRPHRLAANAPDGPLRILGGPGTGKTVAMIGRIAVLLNRGARHDEIAFLTPSGWCAEEMARQLRQLARDFPERRRQMEGEEGWWLEHCGKAAEAAGWVFTGTPAQFAVAFLRQAGVLGRQAEFTLWDDRQATAVITWLAKEVRAFGKVTPGAVDRFYHWYALNLSGFPDDPDLPGEEGWLEVLRLYRSEKRRQGVMDRHEPVLWAIAVMNGNPSLRIEWSHSRSRHILVDGFHDVTASEYAMLKLMTGPTRSITIAADPNQRLREHTYTDWLNLFRLDHRGAGTHVFEFYHRSHEPIFRVANRLAGHPDLKGLSQTSTKPIWTGGEAPTFSVIEGPPQAMFHHLAEKVRNLADRGLAWEDMAVIVPGGYPTGEMLTALVSRNVQFNLQGALWVTDSRRGRGRAARLGQPSDAGRILGLLASVLNPQDWPALCAAASASPRNDARPLNPGDAHTIWQSALERGISVVEAAKYHLQEVDRRSHTYRDLRFFLDARTMLEPMLEDPAASPADLALSALGLLNGIRGGTGEPPEQGNDPDVDKLLDAGRRFRGPDGQTLRQRLAGFLDQVSTALHPGQRPLDHNEMLLPRQKGLTVTTAEAAAGLEWKEVFVIGAVHHLMPIGNWDGYNQQWSEEQHRRLYVALTRAREGLHIVLSRQSGRGFDAGSDRLLDILGDAVEVDYVDPRADRP